MADIFARNKLTYNITIRARFGTTVCALVKAGLGIAVIDQFTVAHGGYPGVELLADHRADPVRHLCRGEARRAAVASCRVFHRFPAAEMRAVEPSRGEPGRPPRRAREKIT